MRARIITGTAVTLAAAAVITACAVNTQAAGYDNTFTFTDSAVTAENTEGSGYKISGTDLTINEAGTYVVTGECAQGSITVKKGTTGVTIILNGLTLTSSTTAPLSVNKNAEAVIQIEGNNVLTDAEDTANESSDDFEGAAIKVKSGSTATITGSGTLTADGSGCKNGIKGGEAATVIIGESSTDTFTLNVSAANNALASDGNVTVNGGNVNITSTGDGLKSSPDEEDTTSQGTVTVNGGNISIVSGEDGIQADNGFDMTGGNVDITSAGGYRYNSVIEASDTSAKGIKSDSYINISGGNITIDAADDGIHTNGENGSENVTVTGGNITIKSGDDGIHSDYILNISGGTVNVDSAVEGYEGAVINLSGGSGTIYTSDDGMNAANSDLTGYTYSLNISGGTWYVNANGDGLDSNGNMDITGGCTEVFGAADNGNGALDIGDGGAYHLNVNPGTIAAVGMSGMAVTPTSGVYVAFGAGGMGMGGMPGDMGNLPGNMGNFGGMQQGGMGNFGGMGMQFDVNTTNTAGSMQNNMFANNGQAIAISAGDTITITDSDGNILYTGTAVKSANHIVFSCEELTGGSEYILLINGTQAATATANGAYYAPADDTDNNDSDDDNTDDNDDNNSDDNDNSSDNNNDDNDNNDPPAPPEGVMPVDENGNPLTPPQGGMPVDENGNPLTPPQGGMPVDENGNPLPPLNENGAAADTDSSSESTTETDSTTSSTSTVSSSTSSTTSTTSTATSSTSTADSTSSGTYVVPYISGYTSVLSTTTSGYISPVTTVKTDTAESDYLTAKAVVKGSKVTLSWNAVKDAESYEIYVERDGVFTKAASTEKNCVTFKNLRNGKDYTFMVRYVKDGVTSDDEHSSSVGATPYFKPAAALTAQGDTAVLSWERVSGAERYAIYKVSGTTVKKMTETTSSKIRIRNYKKGSAYIVRALVDGEWTSMDTGDIVR